MNFEMFYFKDFSMRQSPSGQRINTDSIVFADLIRIESPTCNVLDIGAGSGVLSLMLASRNPLANFTALEPDLDSYTALAANCDDTLWRSRIVPCQTKLQDFSTNQRFDMIICNPPFFESGTRANNKSRAIARHTDQLGQEDLATHAVRLLNPEGYLIILSATEGNPRWIDTLSRNGFTLLETIELADGPDCLPHAKIQRYRILSGSHETQVQRFDYRTKKGGTYSPAMIDLRQRWLRPSAK